MPTLAALAVASVCLAHDNYGYGPAPPTRPALDLRPHLGTSVVQVASRKVDVQLTSLPAPSIAREAFVIQIGAFSTRERAERVQRTAARLGETHLAPISTRQGTLLRVRLGPFRSEREAERMLKVVRKAGFPDAAMTAIP